jgi:hypothetical protein
VLTDVGICAHGCGYMCSRMCIVCVQSVNVCSRIGICAQGLVYVLRDVGICVHGCA